MKAGELNERIEIYKYVVVDSQYGQQRTWIKVFECWARCRFKLGQQKEIAGEIVNSSSNTFKVRHSYSSRIDETMRIYYDGRKYSIKSLNKNRKDDTLIIEGESINE